MIAPAAPEAWDERRAALRRALWSLLGDLPPLHTPEPTVVERRHAAGYTGEKLVFENGAGAQVFGHLLLPERLRAPAPALLYLHLHGGRYDLGKDELFRDDVLGFAPGPALAAAGYVVLCIDAYCFGERQHQGPLGLEEGGAAAEQALFKQFIWRGSTLWGMMLRDDLLALSHLAARPEVDPGRIGAVGMSMGGSRATWLAALDDRVRALAPIAQMTRWTDFAASGRYNLHSIYYYVPGMLASSIDMEHLAALAAPRPQCILIGDDDPLSPIAGVRRVIDEAGAVYRALGAADRFEAHLYPGLGHRYTPAMFSTMLAFMNRHLQPGAE